MIVLYDRALGYGIVRFNRNTRDITIECWPRWSDPSQPDAVQYPGWPVKINQLDNYGREAYGYLPKIQVTGMTDPVVQVIDGENGEVVYTLRIRSTSFQPWVFQDVRLNNLIISEFTIIASNDNLTIIWVSCFISRPKDGIYRVDVGELATDRAKVFKDLRPGRMADGAGVIEIEL